MTPAQLLAIFAGAMLIVVGVVGWLASRDNPTW